MVKKLKNKKPEDIIFTGINTLFMIFAVIVCFYPMYYVVVASFSDSASIYQSGGIMFWPKHFSLESYKLVFQNELLMSGIKNILIIMGVALPINIVMTVMCGYFMASKNVMFKRPIVIYFTITMFISGGLIPTYLNQKGLGFYDNLWALIIPGCLSLYNAIIAKTAIESVPESLIESAYIDGANDMVVMSRIIMPLIKPTLAVLLLYYGVGHWNSWFNASIYIKDKWKLPLQAILRKILIENSELLNATAGMDVTINMYAETIKYAAIVISTLPILCVYPFLQKYFTKGVMIGAVKG